VTLEAQRIDGEGEDEDEIEFSIADSGPGIDAKDQARMFGTFVRGNSGDQGHPGAGLGLALVKSFVALHSGRIEVASTPGRGTTFRVHIPTGRAEPI
jgi:signal transduction histidine kinase